MKGPDLEFIVLVFVLSFFLSFWWQERQYLQQKL